jgi:hypothetical protein
MARPKMEMARRGQIGQPAAIKMEYIRGYFHANSEIPKNPQITGLKKQN